MGGMERGREDSFGKAGKLGFLATFSQKLKSQKAGNTIFT